jgi:hypothetical protein
MCYENVAVFPNDNNKGVTLMFNSTHTTKGALKWVHTIPLRTWGE